MGVRVINLLEWSLGKVTKDADEINREHALLEHERLAANIGQLEAAAIESSTIVVRTLVLVNGGAVIAMMAFMANVVATPNAKNFVGVLDSLSLFAIGVFAAVITACAAYLTHLFYSYDKSSTMKTWKHPYSEQTKKSKRCRWWGRVFHIIAVSAASASVFMFLRGVFSLKCAMVGIL
jgi:hypothetical protein